MIYLLLYTIPCLTIILYAFLNMIECMNHTKGFDDEEFDYLKFVIDLIIAFIPILNFFYCLDKIQILIKAMKG